MQQLLWKAQVVTSLLISVTSATPRARPALFTKMSTCGNQGVIGGSYVVVQTSVCMGRQQRSRPHLRKLGGELRRQRGDGIEVPHVQRDRVDGHLPTTTDLSPVYMSAQTAGRSSIAACDPEQTVSQSTEATLPICRLTCSDMGMHMLVMTRITPRQAVRTRLLSVS